MATAGRSVVFSGLAVAAGLAVLLLPVPFLRSMGVGGLLIPLPSDRGGADAPAGAALAARAPRRCSRSQRRGRRPLGPARLDDHAPAGALPGRRNSVLSRRRRPGALDRADARPAPGPRARRSRPSVCACSVTVSALGPSPPRTVADTGAPGRADDAEVRAAVDRLGDRLVLDPEALIVASGRASPYVDRSGRAARVIVAGRHEYGEESRQLRRAAPRTSSRRRASPWDRASSSAARRRRGWTSSTASTGSSRGSCSPQARACV